MINRLTRVTLLILALAALPAGGAMAQAMGGGGTLPDTGIDTRTKLDPPPPEGGWKALANLLEALKPGVDTRLDPTPSQITDHIERLLNSGRNQEALELIEKRIAETQGQRGTDVQLMFQHARALAALGRTARPEGGWKALANLLEALKPGVDTRLDPTPSQITDHIERLLNSGRNQEALELIEKRIAETQGQRGTDVQLMFQHARALAALGRTA